jgi:hypothetical protein
MNCFNHPEVTAVANCVDCGKALCKECVERHEIAICNDCNVKRSQLEKNLLIKKYIPSMILFVIGFIVGVVMSGELEGFGLIERIFLGLFFGYILAAVVWGWFATRHMFPPKVYVSSGMDYNSFAKSFREVARISCAIFVGMVAMPVGIIKLIRTHIKAKKIAETDGK